jgi:hypothetical protein
MAEYTCGLRGIAQRIIYKQIRIHILSDSWYDSRKFIRVIKELGVNRVQFVKGDFWVSVKGNAMRLDTAFETHKEVR